jgi:hypothetical protein
VEANQKNSYLFWDLLYTLTKVHAHAIVIHVILDKCGIHSSNIIGVALANFASRVRLHFLPPYSPDDNAIERVWKDLHANVTRNHNCATMTELMAEVRYYIPAQTQSPNATIGGPCGICIIAHGYLGGIPLGAQSSAILTIVDNEQEKVKVYIDPISTGTKMTTRDEEIIAKASAARGDVGKKFRAFMNGDDGRHKSQSEADLAFCGLIVFWTRCCCRSGRCRSSFRTSRPTRCPAGCNRCRC